jgi:hypothetical protein
MYLLDGVVFLFVSSPFYPLTVATGPGKPPVCRTSISMTGKGMLSVIGGDVLQELFPITSLLVVGFHIQWNHDDFAIRSRPAGSSTFRLDRFTAFAFRSTLRFHKLSPFVYQNGVIHENEMEKVYEIFWGVSRFLFDAPIYFYLFTWLLFPS